MYKPYIWVPDDCPPVGACLMQDGLCVDYTMDAQFSITKDLCEQYGGVQFLAGQVCTNQNGACFFDEIMGYQLDENTCSSFGSWVDNRCCIDYISTNYYVTQPYCTMNIGGSWMGQGTTCAEGYHDVPEFGPFGVIMVVSIFGLFIFHRRK